LTKKVTRACFFEDKILKFRKKVKRFVPRHTFFADSKKNLTFDSDSKIIRLGSKAKKEKFRRQGV
jgi:hypothetical protein